jgi:hypothetical protein
LPTVKVNMTGVDPEDSLKSDFLQPPPGVHRCRIKECNPSKSKRSGNPMLEVVFQPIEGNFGQVWSYFVFSDESFPKKKMDQFLQAVGVLTKTKRQASFNTDTIIGKQVDVNFRAKREDENTPDGSKGQYRAEVSDVWAPGSEEEFDASGGDPSDEEFDAEEFDAEEDTEEPVEGLYTEAEIKAMDADQLKAELKEYEVKIPPRVRAPKLAELLLKAQADYCESEGIANPAAAPAGTDDEEPEEEEFEEEEDEDEVTDEDYVTEAQLKAMSREDLRSMAEKFDVSVTKKTPSKIIAEILEAQAADEEEPF